MDEIQQIHTTRLPQFLGLKSRDSSGLLAESDFDSDKQSSSLHLSSPISIKSLSLPQPKCRRQLGGWVFFNGKIAVCVRCSCCYELLLLPGLLLKPKTPSNTDLFDDASEEGCDGGVVAGRGDSGFWWGIEETVEERVFEVERRSEMGCGENRVSPFSSNWVVGGAEQVEILVRRAPGRSLEEEMVKARPWPLSLGYLGTMAKTLGGSARMGALHEMGPTWGPPSSI